MRWSSLNSLLLILLASVAIDGILARPLPDTDAIYPRAPTNPPKGKQAASNVPPQTPIRQKLRSAGAAKTPSKIPVSAKKPPRAQSLHPATGGAPSHYNLRPRPNKVATTVVQGKKKVLPPTKIPRPKAGDLKSYNYRDKAIKQGLVYSPGQDKVVHRQLTTPELEHYHADHIVEGQTVAHVLADHPPLNTPQKEAVKRVLNSPTQNLVLTLDKLNINKGVETGRALRGETSKITPGTQRYMTTVADREKNTLEALDKAAGTGSKMQAKQKEIAHNTRTKSPS